VETVERLNDVFEKMSEGGTVSMPLQDAFWGSRFGMLQDKFGINWMFNCELKK
jgi:PhnB protein